MRSRRVVLIAVRVALLLFSSFVAGGGIYNWIDKPSKRVIVPWSGLPSSIHYDMREQTIGEGQLAMLCILTTVTGLILAYESTTVMDDRLKASIILVAGMALILLGVYGARYLFILKRTL